MPILSFPSAKLMGVTVKELTSNSDLQANGMKLIADRHKTLASVSMMDLSVEAEAFGAKSDGNTVKSSDLVGASVAFDKKSVGATVNALIMASVAKGKSHIHGCAREPHIDSLIDFLRSAGAEIDVSGDTVFVTGRELTGGSITVPGDMIEAGTYLCASLITGGDVSVHGFNKDELCSLYEALGPSGVSVVSVKGGVSLTGVPDGYINISTAAYPGFPTDLQPVLSALLAVYRGGKIVENVWQGRFGYLGELGKLGVEYRLCDNRAYISHSNIHSGTLSATDLRGGAAAILLALSADGMSVIEPAIDTSARISLPSRACEKRVMSDGALP